MPADFPKTGELTTGQREARQPGKTKRRRVNAHNRTRARTDHMRCFDGGIDHDSWIRAKPCAVCSLPKEKPQESPTQAAHTVARGMGAARGRWYHLVPLCAFHHDYIGDYGMKALEDSWPIHLGPLARTLAAEHLQELGAIR